MLVFFSDLIEQFRKSANKDVPVHIVFRLTFLNLPSLIFSTIPIVVFFFNYFLLPDFNKKFRVYYYGIIWNIILTTN